MPTPFSPSEVEGPSTSSGRTANLWGAVLSHHPEDELDRCYRLGRLHLCARCLGTYPTMLAVIALLFALRAPLDHPLDLPLGLGLALPATLDWAYGRFQPHRFSNPWRTSTGALLGMALGRSLYIHVQQPLPVILIAQTALVTAVALPVILITYRRRSRG